VHENQMFKNQLQQSLETLRQAFSKANNAQKLELVLQQHVEIAKWEFKYNSMFNFLK